MRAGCVGVLRTFGSPALSVGCGTRQVAQYLLDAECVGAPVAEEPLGHGETFLLVFKWSVWV